MNYEQKYNEMKAKISKIYSLYRDTTIGEKLEDEFPELRGSEVERIMEAINYSINYTFTLCSHIHGVTKDQCINWLQSKKECDSKECDSNCSYKFKVGDTIKEAGGKFVYTITCIDESGYWCNEYFICDFENDKCFDLVS